MVCLPVPLSVRSRFWACEAGVFAFPCQEAVLSAVGLGHQREPGGEILF